MFIPRRTRCFRPCRGWVGTNLATVRKLRKSPGTRVSRNLLTGKKNSGAPGEIRTPDLLLRRQSLYPAELRARSLKLYTRHADGLQWAFRGSEPSQIGRASCRDRVSI